MKRYIKFIAVIALIALPLLLTAGSRDAGAAETKKAKTIDELAAMYDSSTCKQCHEEIYNDWHKSLHARSIFGTGRTAATIKTTVEVGLKGWKHSGVKKPEDVELRHLMVCAKCHLPQLADATDAVAKEIVKAAYTYADPKTSDSEREKAIAKLEKVNINCLICHQRNAITHKWVDGTPDRKTVYGTKDGSHPSPGHPKMKTSPIMGESILCGQCHGQGPNFELENPSQCATLYGSYLFSYRHEGGQESCQECHMKKSKLGHNMQSYRSKALTDMALDFSVEMLPHQWRDGSKMVPETRVIVNMKNKSGHAIPDGWPTPNRLVLEVTSKDSKGKEVFKETKTYMPIPHQLGRGDKMGRGPYDKSGILRETSLAPGKQMHENFTVPFPSGETDMTVTVELWYLPFGTKSDPDNAFLWRKETKKVSLEKGGV